MMNAYDKSYLNDAMENLGDMIDYAICDLGYNPDEFFNWFISSGIATQFQKGNPKYIVGMSGYELTEAVFKTTNIKYKRRKPSYLISKGKEYWAGWILAYYQWETSYTFEYMVSNGLTLSKVISMYILHEADISKFVNNANEIIERNRSINVSNLKRIRKARGFTQQQLSEASGVKIRMIQLYEQRQNDINKAQTNITLSLAKALGCDIEDLLE